MIRGTTPTHIFELEISVENIADLEIAYSQNDRVLFYKRKDDCVLDGNTITLSLTQEETFMFDCSKRVVEIQIRIKTIDGKVPISDIIIDNVEKCLFDCVI